MKSHNVVLMVCLLFIFMVIAGLSVQSCRSHQLDRKTALNIDSTGNQKSDWSHVRDSICNRMQENNFYWEWTSEIYTPVLDSLGKVSGSVLAEKKTLKSGEQQKSGESVAVRNEQKKTVNTSSSLKKRQTEDVKEEDEPVNLSGRIILIVLFVLAVIAAGWMKKNHFI